MRNPEDIARLSYHLSSPPFGIIKNLTIEWQLLVNGIIMGKSLCFIVLRALSHG